MATRGHFIDSLSERAGNMSLLMQASGEQSVIAITVRSGMLETAAQIFAQRKGVL